MKLELFRALFPRWNFFDRVSSELRLEIKPYGAANWQPLEFATARERFGLFLNPLVTLRLAEKALISDFANDLSHLISSDGRVDMTSVERLTTYRMVRSLVSLRLRGFETNANEMQFRISDESNVVFISNLFGAST